jgi:hypothetical protein
MSWREQVDFQRDGDRVRFVKHQQAELEFLIVLAHWNNSPRVEMLPHTWCWFRANQSLLFSLMMRAQQRRKVDFLFIDIGGIVNHHSLDYLYIKHI